MTAMFAALKLGIERNCVTTDEMLRVPVFMA
jgi:hypothetical protein